MIEEQLRHRLAATAEVIDESSVPLATIRRDGVHLRRRRTRRRVTGVAATVAGVAAVALVVPMIGPGSNGVTPATASPRPGSDTPPTAPSPPDGVDREWPPPGGLAEALEMISAGPAQRRAVEDDRVTRGEYEAGFDRYRRCLEESGYQLARVDRTRLVFDYAVPSAAVDTGVDDRCYLRQFKFVDMAWQLAHATGSSR